MSDPETPDINLDDSSLYINMHLSLLQFNLRVLEQVLDERHPLLERLKFLLIFSRNMDEFFEIRLAGVIQELEFNQVFSRPDGLRPHEIIEQASELCHNATDKQYQILNDILIPQLEHEGIRFLARERWNEAQTQWIKRFFREQVQPVLTPIGLDLAHPFPRLINKSLNFIVSLDGKDAFGRQLGLAIIPAPQSLARLIQLPETLSEGNDDYVFLSSVIHDNASALFPGMSVKGCYQFRVTRNADIDLDEDNIDDLSAAVKSELLSRRYGDEVRLEVADNTPKLLTEFLLRKFGLTEKQVYEVHGPVNLNRLMAITNIDRPDLKFPPFTPGISSAIKKKQTIFDAITEKDILVHHPYESFNPVINFLREAAHDPDVVAIKQTLYRTGQHSEVLDLLVEAARHGKEVTAVIELRARFDEEHNIETARRLQEAGAIVVYGVVGYKTHAKMIMVLRRKKNKLKRFIHLSTGNYHIDTARVYTDYGLLSADDSLCEDVSKIFLELTGMGRAAKLKQLLHAPFTLHKGILALIETERQNALDGKPARIKAKCNALTEPEIIKALYRASQAGVEIDLVIRGMCCLRPGIAGVSDNIRVRSIIGRFLEHSRIYYFHNNGDNSLYLSSADLMERNAFKRVEIAFPINDSNLKKRIIKEGLDTLLADNCQSWQLQSDGHYDALQPGRAQPRGAQHMLLERLAKT